MTEIDYELVWRAFAAWYRKEHPDDPYLSELSRDELRDAMTKYKQERYS